MNLFAQFEEKEFIYIRDCFGKQHSCFGHLVNSVASSPDYARFLKHHVCLFQEWSRKSHLRVLEIGCFAGLSTFSIVEGILQYSNGQGKVTVIDPGSHFNNLFPGEVFDSYGRDLATYGQLDLMRYNIGCLGWQQWIDLIPGYASDITPSLRDGSFYLIAIDGARGYESVVNDMQQACRLIRQGGVISAERMRLERGIILAVTSQGFAICRLCIQWFQP